MSPGWDDVFIIVTTYYWNLVLFSGLEIVVRLEKKRLNLQNSLYSLRDNNNFVLVEVQIIGVQRLTTTASSY